MTGARMNTLATLRGEIGRLETADTRLDRRVSLGHAAVDATLQGGLALGALHEVYAAGQHGAAAAGFAAALAQRVTDRRCLLWVRQDFAARELGELSMSGFAELGLDPRRIIVLHASDAGSALRAAADALTCNALGAVVLELWGETKVVDLCASRKLTLATQASGVTNILLRIAAHPVESAAMTRWVVRSAPSDAFNDCWGGPVFDVELSRNRRGQTGRWIMEWNSDARSFSAAADHGGLVAIPADRPHRTAAHSPIAWRRTG